MSGDIAIGAVVGIGLIAAMMSVLLRQYRPEFALLTALAATDLECVTGHVTFDANGDPIKSVAVTEFKGGEAVLNAKVSA